MKSLLVYCVILVSVVSSYAQGRIDKVIDQMEKSPGVETTYTERRSPKKKKLIMTSRVFNFTNQAYYARLKKAFEEERTNSISAVKTNSQMTYRFEDDKGVSTYTLSWNGDNGPFTMVMTWRSNDSKDAAWLENWDGDVENLTCDLSNEKIIVLGNNTIVRCSSDMSDGKTSQQVYRVRNDVAKARRDAQVQAAKARKEAAKARKQAAKARRDAHAQAAKARKEAAKARKQAAKARRDAYAQAAKARKEAAKARQQAAKARREASKIRMNAIKSQINTKSTSGEADVEMNSDFITI